jgi:hypothetical protein
MIFLPRYALVVSLIFRGKKLSRSLLPSAAKNKQFALRNSHQVLQTLRRLAPLPSSALTDRQS